MNYNNSQKNIKNIRLNIGRIFFFLTLLLSLSSNTTAQSYFFDNYGVSEGLAQSTVFSVYQDNKHIVWLGTRAGLSRFDGKYFENYSIEDGLAPNGVKVIFEDSLNRIWIGHTGGGITILENNKFTIFAAPEEIFNSDITAITADKQGSIWIASELSGTIKIDNTEETLKESTYEHFIGNKLSDRVFGACTLKSGNTIFITDAFLKTYNHELKKFENFELNGMPRYFQITCLFEDSNSHIWIGTHHGGLYEYLPEKNEFKFYDYIREGIGSNWITAISEDTNRNIFIGTWGGGLTKIDPTRNITNYHATNGLNDTKIRSICPDAEGNILFGTNEHGLALFKGELFTGYYGENEFLNAQVWSILETSKGEFWFGTNRGLTIYNPEKSGKDAFSKFPKLDGTSIKILKEDSENQIWIATDAQGIFTYLVKNGIYTYEGKLNNNINNLKVNALETDKKGNVWVGTLDGLIRYKFSDRSMDHYTQTAGLSGNDISALYFDKNSVLWIGSRGNGINCLKDGAFEKIDLKEKYTPTCFTEDRDGNIWMGTEAHGVILVSQKTKKEVSAYTEQNGIFANYINLIHCDKNGIIYIGTNKGVNVIHPKTGLIYGYSKHNGLTGIETKPNAVIEDKSENLWFGTIAGAFRYNPKLVSTQIIQPFTHIIKMKVNLTDRQMVEDMSLNNSQNNIIFEYTSICLSNPDAVKYKIFLEGADKEWRTVTENSVTYPALMPNSYTFNVIAQNGEGIWNEKPIQYKFEIRPPFYKTWWFLIGCIIVGTFLVLLYIKIRVKTLKEQNRILEEKVEERTAEVVAQKEELSVKNKDITDSIQYAKRIQFAVIPAELPFEDTFILLKPKDIVSGDFYWVYKYGNLEFIAAVDCTGHGVPGAFMSIIGCNLLNKVIRENHIYQPSKILDALNEELLLSLPSQEGEIIQDGMDMSIVCFNTETSTLEYAGAFNPLYVIKNGEMEEMKADRFSIGRSSLEMKNHFNNYTIDIKKGDIIYMLSDGYADQFGGPDGKKFKYKTLKDLLTSICTESMQTQQTILDKTIEEWRGSLEQVDDILIIGRRF